MSIIFSGGGTLGPTMSLVPIIKEVQKRTTIPCHFIAPIGSQGKEVIEQLGLSWNEIPAGKLQRYPSFGWFSAVPNSIRGYLAAGKLLDAFSAKVVVTSGSFVSPPVIWRAKYKSIATVLIQLDIETGLANKLSMPAATKTFYSYRTAGVDRDVVIGPMLPHKTSAASKVDVPPGFEKELPTIFITGGGTGAQEINELVWNALPALTNRANIVHTTGRGKEREGYEYKRYLQVPFLPPPDYYFWLTKATLAIGRAGMGFLADCVAFKKPAIVIPMLHTHQEANAVFFADKQAVITPKQHEHNEAWLLTHIDMLLSDSAKRDGYAKRVGSLAKEGGVETVINSILTLHG